MSTIMVVEDEQKTYLVLERILSNQGYRTISAQNGQEALDMMENHPVDLILLDIVMPGMSGFEVCRNLKQNPRRQFIPIILVTGRVRQEDKIKGIEAGADDFLNKPVNVPEMLARIRSLLRLKSLTDQLDSAEAVIFSLAETVEARDAYTGNHTGSVAKTAIAIGRKMGLPDKQINVLKRGGILHDIGKIGIPDNILNKRGPLTAEEFETMKKHPLIGYEICKPLKTTKGLLEVILHHHEKLDGSGYPDGLKEDEIPLTVRIIAVADIYDSLTSDRVYRSRLGLQATFEIMDREAESNHIDSEVLDALKKIVFQETKFKRVPSGKETARDELYGQGLLQSSRNPEWGKKPPAPADEGMERPREHFSIKGHSAFSEAY